MNIYNLIVTGSKQWDMKLDVTHKPDVLSVYCWHVIYFDFLYHNADVCLFAKTTALFNNNYIFIQYKSIVFTLFMKFAINQT